MEELAELLFELSSSDRLNLLLEIKTKKQRPSQLAQKLSATTQETFRHLERLSKAKLIEKDSDGLYGLTAYGELILSFLPSLNFISKNRKYLLWHDFSFLPPEFLLRIGELSEHERAKKVIEVLRGSERTMDEAKEYLWFMAQEILPKWYSYPALSDSNVALKFICPTDGVEPEEYQEARRRYGARFELRIFDDVRVGLALNEKFAGLCFPDLTGRVDLGSSIAMRGDNPSFHKWCRDLFTFYWEKAKKGPPHQPLDPQFARYDIR